MILNVLENNDYRKRKVDEFKLEINEKKFKSKTKRREKKNNKIPTVKLRKSTERKKLFKIVFLTYVTAMVLMLGQFFVFGMCDMLAMTRAEEVVTVEIPKNSSKRQIANILFEKGVIKEKSFFRLYMQFTSASKKIVPGTFEIKTNLDYQAIISFLRSNSNRLSSDLINVTIPEGKNVQEIGEILEKNEICTKDEFIKACKSENFENSFAFLKEMNDKNLYSKLEGYLFPDTYGFYKNIEPRVVIKKLLNNFEKKLNNTDDTDEDGNSVSLKEKAERKGFSVKNLINIASLIQAEAANEDDMYIVSSVIQNRLATAKTAGKSPFGDQGLANLGLDSTVWYPYKSKDKVPQKMIETYERPYDTYKNEGLPIGPICNPGMVAIDAALNPKNTQYYYFCHSNERKSFYAKTLAEHEANLKKAGLRT